MHHPQHDFQPMVEQPAMAPEAYGQPGPFCSVAAVGAAREVGRSAVVVQLGACKVLCDCGIHPTEEGENHWPDVASRVNPPFDVVLISHIHIDHCGALVWLAQVLNGAREVFMTEPSRELLGIQLHDALRVADPKSARYESRDVDELCQRVRVIDFGQRLQLANGVFVTAMPAGHLLGACGFLIESRGVSVFYSGDFSSGADHHLGGEAFSCLRPSLMLTESTYGGTNREPIWRRRKSFLQEVHGVIRAGGRVLIPVFAIGRLQELCILLNDFWERVGLQEPIFVASGMGVRANEVYKRSVRWMNETVRDNIFDEGKEFLNLPHVERLPPRGADANVAARPCVVLATAGMLNAGDSYKLLVAEKWSEDPRNLLLFAGYQAKGSLGRAIQERQGSHVRWVKRSGADRGEVVEFEVRCRVEHVSFSGHADQDEICRVIDRIQPRRVATMHGEVGAVESLAAKVRSMGIASEVAGFGETIVVEAVALQRVRIDESCLVDGAVTGTLERVDPSRVSECNAEWQVVPAAAKPCTFALRRRVETFSSEDEVRRVFGRLHPEGAVDGCHMSSPRIGTLEIRREASREWAIEGPLVVVYINHDGKKSDAINRFVTSLSYGGRPVPSDPGRGCMTAQGEVPTMWAPAMVGQGPPRAWPGRS